MKTRTLEPGLQAAIDILRRHYKEMKPDGFCHSEAVAHYRAGFMDAIVVLESKVKDL